MQMQTFELIEPVGPADHVLGPFNAPVTIVEYGDFECSTCKQVSGAIKQLLARYDSRVRFVFRHFPLEQTHPHALQAAEIAECAGAQGRFWQMHDLLFENQRHLKLVQLYRYATELSLDMPRVIAEMDDEIYLQRVREHQRAAVDSGVRATPAFFVNGRLEDTSYGMRSMFDAVDVELRMGPDRQSPVDRR